MIFSIIFYRPLMTGLLSILHIWYTYSDIISTVHFRRTSAACQATTRRSQRLCTTTMWRSNIFEITPKIKIKPLNNGISWIHLFCFWCQCLVILPFFWRSFLAIFKSTSHQHQQRGWCASLKTEAPLQNDTFNYLSPVCSDCTSKIGLQQQWQCTHWDIGFSNLYFTLPKL